MNKSSRHAVFLVLKKVLGEKAYLNMALKEINREYLDDRDIAFITSLSNFTIEHLNQIDFALNHFIKGKRVHGSIRNILRIAVCEMLFMQTPERAAVSEAVNLCGSIGKQSLKGFVNAVLRNFINDKDKIVYPEIDDDLKKYLLVFSGYKSWFIDQIIEDYGKTFAKDFLLYNRKDKDDTHIRINTLKGSSDRIIKGLTAEGLVVRLDPDIKNGAHIKNLTGIETRHAFNEGLIAVQGKASMLSVMLAGVKSKMRVLDACAAPGGKTAYMSALMENTGEITAFDIHAHRISLMNKNLTRLGCLNVKTSVKDAAEYDESLKDKFDLVFLDLPCSSMGLAYKKADIRLFKEKEDIISLASLQKDMLNAAKNYVKPGGILMVVICSITREESDLSWFFKKNKAFSEMDMMIPESINYLKAEHGIKLFPHVSGMDGFFICKMKKSE